MNLIDFILHFDRYLSSILVNYGAFTYLFLFVIVFLETGLVITPFLPGDSLLFIAGAFASRGALSLIALFFIFSVAAIAGDTLNYWIGSYFGERVFASSRFFKKEHLQKTKDFYKKYGGKTIILARFIPIIRTFAPFVAGVGKMDYFKFISYNIIGGILWVTIFLLAGFYFGNIPFVENNLTLIVFLIIFLSILPPVIEYLRTRKK